MANTTVYPYGTDGQLPSSIGIINDLMTGGADKALSAEQGKAIGETLYGQIFTGLITINQSGIISCGATIASGTNKWASYSNYYGSLIDISDYNASLIKIYKNKNGNHIDYTFLVSGVDVGQTPEYASGYNQVLTSNNDVEVVPPSDAKFLYVYMNSNGTVYTPDKIEINASIRKSGILDDLSGVLLQVDVSGLSSCGGSISRVTNKWQSVSNYYGSLIDVEAFRNNTAIIKRNENGNQFEYTFLTAGVSVGNTPEYATGYYSTLFSYEDVELAIPDDAKYLYVYLKSQSTVYTPSEITIYNNESTGREIAVCREENDKQSSFLRVLAPKRIKIASYNIGHFSGGSSKNSSITSENYATKLSEYRQLVDTIDPDVLGLVEYSRIFGKNTNNEDVYTRDVLLPDFIHHEGAQTNYSCNSVYARTVVENIKRCEYLCNQSATITHTTAINAQDYYFLDADLWLRGTHVKLVVTHLAFDNNNAQVCSDQIDELITRYAEYDKVIMMGDWNWTTGFSQLSTPFLAAGYSLANDGTIVTYPSTSKALDNIVVKGLTISNPGAIQTSGLSDHYPFYCEIEV